MRYNQEIDSSFGGYYSQPDVQFDEIAPFDGGFYGLPVGPTVATTGPVYRELTPIDPNPFYGLPVGPNYGLPVSRVGPTASVAPRAALDPNVRAGSLFAGGFPTQANFRAGKGYMAQRGIVAQMWERLRRRKRGPQAR